MTRLKLDDAGTAAALACGKSIEAAHGVQLAVAFLVGGELGERLRAGFGLPLGKWPSDQQQAAELALVAVVES